MQITQGVLKNSSVYGVTFEDKYSDIKSILTSNDYNSKYLLNTDTSMSQTSTILSNKRMYYNIVEGCTGVTCNVINGKFENTVLQGASGLTNYIMDGYFSACTLTNYIIYGGKFYNCNIDSSNKWIDGVWDNVSAPPELNNAFNGVWNSGVFSSLYGWSGGTFNGGVFQLPAEWFDGVANGGTFSGITWHNGLVRNADFIDGCEFLDGVFNNGNFTGSIFSGGIFNNGNMYNSTISGGTFYNGNFSGCIVDNGEIEGGNFSDDIINYANVYNIEAINLSIYDGNFYNGNYKNIIFSGGNIYNGFYLSCEISGVTIHNGTFNNCTFNSTHVHNCNFTNCKSTDLTWMHGVYTEGEMYNSHWYDGYWNDGIFSAIGTPITGISNTIEITPITTTTTTSLVGTTTTTTTTTPPTTTTTTTGPGKFTFYARYGINMYDFVRSNIRIPDFTSYMPLDGTIGESKQLSMVSNIITGDNFSIELTGTTVLPGDETFKVFIYSGPTYSDSDLYYCQVIPFGYANIRITNLNLPDIYIYQNVMVEINDSSSCPTTTTTTTTIP